MQRGIFFWGLTVPKQREIAKKFDNPDFEQLASLISSKIHEHRLTALLVLVEKYEKCDRLKNAFERKKIYQFYIDNISWVNNWELVDLSASRILGDYLYNEEKGTLWGFAHSNNLWLRRIAVVSSFYFVKKGDYDFTLRVCKRLLNDKEDLIHKACGWMLREIGKRDVCILQGFLDDYSKQMPRTMLRYSIEKLDPKEKKHYMKR